MMDTDGTQKPESTKSPKRRDLALGVAAVRSYVWTNMRFHRSCARTAARKLP